MPRRKPNRDPDDDKLREDVNETAFRTVQAAIGEAEKPIPPSERTEAEKDATAAERGRKGGQKGGKARAEKLSPERRVEIAKKAAKARWPSEDRE